MKTLKKLENSGECSPESKIFRITVTVDEETRRAAERIGRDYAGRKLETVLAAFVGDLAVAADRSGSWEAERVEAWLGSHVWECEREVEPCR